MATTRMKILRPRSGRHAVAACLLVALGFFACQGPTSSGHPPDGESAAVADPGAEKSRNASGPEASSETVPAAPTLPGARNGGGAEPSGAGEEPSTPAPPSGRPLPRDPSVTAPDEAATPAAAGKPREGAGEGTP
ncbi:MAG TPA: hypothetical protein VMT52_19945, partial [Planctomycetota bacterium]|nr:hypothetical protein [Planctomycetota bacterium]